MPVLLEQSVAGLNIKPDGIYVDVTFGGGGHSKEILKYLERGRLFGFDQDDDTLKNNPDHPQFTFIKGNFRFLKQFLRYHKVFGVDGILADLGVSSHHFDDKERGFSFRFDSKLDMRMNRSSDLSALEVLNEYEEDKLADVFFYYGEVRNARLLASQVVKRRKDKPFKTTGDLKEIAQSCTGKKQEMKYLSQVFQALRIEVNDEMDALKKMMEQAGDVLNKGGRLSIITYHSLEDRLVKNFLRSGNFKGDLVKDFYGNVQSPFSLVNKKIIVADKLELEKNSRARSAKLRIAEKI